MVTAGLRRQLLAGVAVVGLIAAACSPQPSPSSSEPPTPGPTPTSVTAIEGPTATPTAAEPVVATSNLATLTVTPRSAGVAGGDEWTVDVELHNGREVPVIYGNGPCDAFASLTLTIPIPLEPVGEAWSGPEAAFKGYALTKGLAAGGVPATDPMTSQVSDPDCRDFGDMFPELAPGETLTRTITWKAQLIGALDPLPGPVDFVVSVGIDPDRTEPPPPPPGGGPIGSWTPFFKSLTVAGRLIVEAGDQHPISIGQAIDAVLGEAVFTRWLAAQPAGTCTGVNVLLVGGQAGSLIPPGPNWEIDVFCEQGVPRHWLIATVDPFTAEVTGINRCDVPCDR